MTSYEALRRRVLPVVVGLPLSASLGQRAAANTVWLVGERVLRMGVAFAVTVWIVRYLGPRDFGILAYALSLTMIADAVATMGLRSIVVRELVEHPEREREIIGTALGLRLVGAVLAGGVAIALVWQFDQSWRALAVVAVLAASLPASAFSAIDQSFQATLQAHHAVRARSAGFAVSTAAKLALLVGRAPLIAFAVASALEFVVAAFGYTVIYRRRKGIALGSLRFSLRTARRLLAMSWPLFISALAAAVYLKVDQVMLQHLVGPDEVGIYAAAARLSEVWYFIPVALASSLLPLFVARRGDPAAYGASLQRTFDIAAWIAIALAAAVTVVAGAGVGFLYGADYARTAEILRVHVWASPFIFMSTVLGRALIAEGLQRFELVRHVAGAVLNVALNLLLIPPLGGMGAAIATVISYSAAAYFVCWSYPPVWRQARHMTKAMALPLRAGAYWNAHRATSAG